MKRPKIFSEELELEQLRATEQELHRREKESAENRERLVRERSEQERERSEQEHTIPPLEKGRARDPRILEEINVSRGEVTILLKAQYRGLLALVLLVAAICALVWWSVEIMQGG